MTECTCQQHGYCPALGRQMPEARWRECSTNESFCEMFHREAAAGKYQAAHYQTPYDPNAPQKTPIELSKWRIAKNAIQHSKTILFGSKAHNSQIERRANVCRTCEFAKEKTCALCGCGFEAKQQKRSSFCPVLKWDGDVERFANETPHNHVAVGITTCERKEPTLMETRDSLTAAGFRYHTIITDVNKDGAWNTFRRGLAQLIASYPNASAYLMFQDDVAVAKGLAEYLPSILWPDESTGVVSLYCCGMYRFDSDGLHLRNGTTWGALALCYAAIRTAVREDDVDANQRGGGHRRKGFPVVDRKSVV